MVNPTMTPMVGPDYGLENYTFGAMMAHQMLLFTAVTVGNMSILLTARRTRAEEEDGCIEIVRSLPAGRLSHLLAVILVLFGTNVLLALGMGFGLYALGIESMDVKGSLLYGAALGAVGCFFTGITALFAQLSESSCGTIGLSFTMLGVSYLIRAISDVSNETLSWFSPCKQLLVAGHRNCSSFYRSRCYGAVFKFHSRYRLRVFTVKARQKVRIFLFTKSFWACI
ncbi:hypothetical protein ACE1TI_00460 [Alteribacillus sp. JSM 102045]|uniref:hypothetical protein n=1 Tax=Alteribacillus sp. JSM 102045 TaxID=1562101 RepID=UPI0035C0B600